MTDENRFEILLITFMGTPVEAVLREMGDELGKAHAFQFVHLILTRAEQIAEMWREETGNG